jgi:hypothetical protein
MDAFSNVFGRGAVLRCNAEPPRLFELPGWGFAPCPFKFPASWQRFEIALDAAGRLHQGAGEIAETLETQAQAAFGTAAPDIEDDRAALAAVAYAFFSSMQVNHHNFALPPPVGLLDVPLA